MTEQERKMLTKPKFDRVLQKVIYGILGTAFLYALYNIAFPAADYGVSINRWLFTMGGIFLAMGLNIVLTVRDLKQVTPIYKDIMKKLKEQ